MAGEQLTLQSVSALLTPQILQKAAQTIYSKKFYADDIVRIAKTDVELASAKGDGFLGIIYRIRVTLANGTELRLIGKGMPANVVRRKTFQCEKWFAREIQFYNVVCPAFMKLGAKFLSVPDCYYAVSDGMNDFLLLEDLVDSGYQMADKAQGLNTIQTISIVKMMARYHALSLSMKVLQPEKYLEITDCIQESLFHNGGEEWLGGYYTTLTKLILNAVEHDLQDTHYLEKFKAFSETKALFEKVRQFTEKDELRVVNHGDSWAANFMFDATGALVKAIDFQITRNSSLMLDLSTVIFACTTDEHRNNVGGVKGILHIYHEEMCKTMTALGVAEPHVAEISFERIHTMWKELGAFGLGNSIELVPLSMQEKDDFEDMDSAKGEEPSTIEELTTFTPITAPEKIKRLVDMIKLGVDEGLI